MQHTPLPLEDAASRERSSTTPALTGPLALVINPAAGRGEADLAAIREAFGDAMPALVYETTPERDADACAREAVAAGARAVIAAGGDGTASLVASALVGTDVALGLLPLGTSNSVAEALGLPGDLAGAARAILAGATRRIDTARVNGRAMLLTASVGVYADTIGDTGREEKNRWGLLAYAATALEKLLALAPFTVEFEADGLVARCEAVAVTVANLAPARCVMAQGAARVDPADGLLDVTVVSSSGPASLVAAGIHLYQTAGRAPADREDVEYFPARRVRVVTEPTQRAIVDGEDVGPVALDVACLPASLAVFAP